MKTSTINSTATRKEAGMNERKGNIVILNGHPTGNDKDYQKYVAELAATLGEKGLAVTIYHLCEREIKYCTGCWSCWWATPGRCILNDEMEDIYREIMAADQVLYISPMVAGYVSAMTKKVMDRMVPLIHPYIEVVEGECHHRKRYEKYPSLALVVQAEIGSDEDDLEIIKELMSRLALNFRGSCDYVHTMAEGIEEVRNETCYT